jgi:hypothetical protein
MEQLFKTIDRSLLPKIRHMMEFLLKNDHFVKVYEMKTGLVFDVYDKLPEESRRKKGTFSVEHVVFVILPALLGHDQVMYCPYMINKHIEDMYDEFMVRYTTKNPKPQEHYVQE